LLTLISITAHAQQRLVWPHHKKSVIILTYDDALPSQLKTAVPQLEKANLTATFFLTGASVDKSITQWREVAKAGFELGNHTIYHPCASGNDNPVISDNYTVYEMIREIDVMNHFLYAVDGKTTRTYAYPCTETTVGNGKSYVDTLRKYGVVKYARVGGDMDAVITNFKNLDLLQIPSYGIEDNAPADKLIAFVKKVEESGGMGVIMFHGVGGDYITTSADAHRELLAYLKANQRDIWITPFQQAMDYINAANKSERSHS